MENLLEGREIIINSAIYKFSLFLPFGVIIFGNQIAFRELLSSEMLVSMLGNMLQSQLPRRIRTICFLKRSKKMKFGDPR